MLPIDLMVELLILNVNYRDDDNCVDVCVSTDPLLILVSESMTGLRSKIRSHLQSLVPPPKLLSECEEGVWFIDDEGEIVMHSENVVFRATRKNAMVSSFTADTFVVRAIQPVEVNRE